MAFIIGIVYIFLTAYVMCCGVVALGHALDIGL